MRAIDILWYLLGRRDAIQRIATSHVSLYVGFLLVLMAGIAREYDQTFIPEFGLRFIVPVFSSFFAAAIIYFSLTLVLLPSKAPLNPGEVEPTHSSFRCFLSLFWMTAPLAWVYAFPAEHLYPPHEAAWINVGLLTFVATARVLLLSRVLSVVLEISFLRTFSAVMCISALIMAVGSVGTSLSLIKMMGGLSNSPEETVTKQAAETALGLSMFGFLFFAFLCIILRIAEKQYRKGFPAQTENAKMPTGFLIVASVAWIVALIPQQQKLLLNYSARHLMREKNYVGMLAFLSKHSPDDFNKVHRLSPDPYSYEGSMTLPDIIKALNGTEAPWVRAMLLDDLDITLQHPDAMYGRFDRSTVLSLGHVLTFTDGESWVKAHAKLIEAHMNDRSDIDPELESLAKQLMALGLKIKLPEQKP